MPRSNHAMKSLQLLAIAASLSAALPAYASSSDWYKSEGGQVRLVTSGKPDAQGRIQGVLDIELEPGWKTYWRDPGGSGVPPQLDVSRSANISNAELSFPAPQRHDDGYGAWAGYDHSVSFPVVFTMASPEGATIMDADIFLGMCETICIPVHAKLTLDLASDPDNADDRAVVQAGFSALPGPAKPDFSAKPLPGTPEALIVEAAASGDPASVDLFVAGESDYMFGTPKRSQQAGKVIFTVPILDRPTTTPSGAGLHYTLTSAAGAVQGFLPYP